jgi:hypothetical protein
MAEKRRGRAEKRAATAGYFPPAGALNFFTTPPSGDSFVRPRARKRVLSEDYPAWSLVGAAIKRAISNGGSFLNTVS